jgi:hypothetical protein
LNPPSSGPDAISFLLNAAEYIAETDQVDNLALGDRIGPTLTKGIMYPFTGEPDVNDLGSVLIESGSTGGGYALGGATQSILAEGTPTEFANELEGEQTKEKSNTVPIVPNNVHRLLFLQGRHESSTSNEGLRNRIKPFY